MLTLCCGRQARSPGRVLPDKGVCLPGALGPPESPRRPWRRAPGGGFTLSRVTRPSTKSAGLRPEKAIRDYFAVPPTSVGATTMALSKGQGRCKASPQLGQTPPDNPALAKASDLYQRNRYKSPRRGAEEDTRAFLSPSVSPINSPLSTAPFLWAAQSGPSGVPALTSHLCVSRGRDRSHTVQGRWHPSTGPLHKTPDENHVTSESQRRQTLVGHGPRRGPSHAPSADTFGWSSPPRKLN